MPSILDFYEPLSNIGLVCKKHASHPQEELINQARTAPLSFLGRAVKKCFSGKMPDGRSINEHMWVELVSWDGEQFSGPLDNVPVSDIDGIEEGTIVNVRPEEIEEVD